MQINKLLLILLILVPAFIFPADKGQQLIKAAKNGELKEVEELLKGLSADVNKKNDKLTIINTKDNNGNTALIWAAYHNRVAVAKLLLENKANVELKSKYGETALMFASRFDYVDVLELLLNHGADINAIGNDDRTALMRASQYGRTNSVELLLNRNADVTIKDKYGNTALKLAKDEGHKRAAELLEIYNNEYLLYKERTRKEIQATRAFLQNNMPDVLLNIISDYSGAFQFSEFLKMNNEEQKKSNGIKSPRKRKHSEIEA